ncbi:HNH endonuclease [Streptomyces canus]|uniref:HNH endonuclease n=1 Tax=Streptomyces canus TaxID=58343 RepID=UPI00225A0744|nr:HNH endonuclease [Streptomyces canus]MCX5253565.1 HNH endonuclease [Streptomyces canus]
MAVSKRLRYEILRRDNHACRYCGATAPGAKLNVDHVIPQSLGGSDKPENLVTSCADCNAGKTSSMPNAMPVADVDQETFREAARLKQEAERRQEGISLHLYMVWIWAHETTGRTPSRGEQSYFMGEIHKALACGASAHVDLTGPAYRAGRDNALDIVSYIRLPPESASPEAVRFVHTVKAVGEWESERDYVTPTGDASLFEVKLLIKEIHKALDAGFPGATVVKASARAGRDMSLDLFGYLQSSAPVGEGV